MPTPPDPEDWPSRRVYDSTWQSLLFDAGYAGIDWPAEFGGRGAGAAEQLIFLEETYRGRAPDIGLNFIGLSHAGPTIAAAGKPEQKAARLPGILSGNEIWCRGSRNLRPDRIWRRCELKLGGMATNTSFRAENLDQLCPYG